jgi:hypothetical protein
MLQKKGTGRMKLLACTLVVIFGLIGWAGCSGHFGSGSSKAIHENHQAGIANPQTETVSKIGAPHKNKHAYHILGDYDAEIREVAPRADGIHHVDTQAMIATLKELHVTTYYYLIWHEKTDWNDLREEFLPAAQQAGINVVVYLVPPTESRGTRKSYPYTTHYIKWAKAIANLSLQYPNLTGWVIDDFTGNLNFFTPDYVKQMTDSAKAINPKLIFRPIVYYNKASSSTFAQNYGPYIDGIIFPYKGFYDLKPLPGKLDQITKLYHPKSVVLMVYAAKYSKEKFPPPVKYVKKALQIGLNHKRHGKLAGVTTYLLPLQPHKEKCNKLKFPNHLQLSIPWNTSTKAGIFVEASQKVQIDPSASSYQISFWQQDSFEKLALDENYHKKQLLVDGQVVWNGDVASDSANKWAKKSFDLTSYLQGKTSATITFRLYEQRGVSNFGIDVDIAHIQAQGFDVVNPDFTEKIGWTFNSTADYAHANYEQHTCDPNRTIKMFNYVKDLYSSWWGH